MLCYAITSKYQYRKIEFNLRKYFSIYLRNINIPKFKNCETHGKIKKTFNLYIWLHLSQEIYNCCLLKKKISFHFKKVMISKQIVISLFRPFFKIKQLLCETFFVSIEKIYNI